MPIRIDEGLCIRGCTLCDQFCPGDIIYRLDTQKIPEIRYEDECWYCGSCEEYCPTGAVKIVFPREMLHSQTPAESLFGKPPEIRKGDNRAPNMDENKTSERPRRPNETTGGNSA